WYRDNKINNDQNFLMQYNPISLCVELSNNYAIANAFNLEYIKQLQKGELYILVLRNINNTRSKYGYAYRLMKKIIDVAINNDQSENAPITNPIIFVRRRKPPGRAKSNVEIQESSTKNVAICLILIPTSNHLIIESDVKDVVKRVIIGLS
ncbi:38918_t:CDS:2, partial [Gigaspora margarita]